MVHYHHTKEAKPVCHAWRAHGEPKTVLYYQLTVSMVLTRVLDGRACNLL